MVIADDCVKPCWRRIFHWSRSEGFVTKLEEQVGNRQQLEVVSVGQTWVLRERYESVFEAENRPIATFKALNY